MYDLLGLGDISYNASQDQIKAAYRKMVLKYHPDKIGTGESTPKEIKELFLKIQHANEILSNPDKRRGYDSNFHFDEWIPDEPIPESDFYSVYVPIFQSNSRFSENKPCPELGDETTSYEDLMKFYRFWRNFKSWRDFSQFDEQDEDVYLYFCFYIRFYIRFIYLF